MSEPLNRAEAEPGLHRSSYQDANTRIVLDFALYPPHQWENTDYGASHCEIDMTRTVNSATFGFNIKDVRSLSLVRDNDPKLPAAFGNETPCTLADYSAVYKGVPNINSQIYVLIDRPLAPIFINGKPITLLQDMLMIGKKRCKFGLWGRIGRQSIVKVERNGNSTILQYGIYAGQIGKPPICLMHTVQFPTNGWQQFKEAIKGSFPASNELERSLAELGISTSFRLADTEETQRILAALTRQDLSRQSQIV